MDQTHSEKRREKKRKNEIESNVNEGNLKKNQHREGNTKKKRGENLAARGETERGQQFHGIKMQQPLLLFFFLNLELNPFEVANFGSSSDP